MDVRGRFAAVAVVLAATAIVACDSPRHSIRLQDIVSGGPPKDGIPALLQPRFLNVASATFLRPDDRVIGVEEDGIAKAYPLRILNWHEVVNDTLAATPIAVTY